MTGWIALSGFCLWLLWIYYHDTKERVLVSGAAWIVLLWAISHGTRPVTNWFIEPDFEGMGSRDEGNPIEAAVDSFIIICGLLALRRRRIRFSVLIRDNIWVMLLYLFWLMSVFWSDYPFITFKRVFRDIGTIVMVLVVLTDINPGQTIRAVCIRLACAGIPLSIILFKYFPEYGRVYAGFNKSDLMYAGVTTHKNTLGVLAMTAALFLLWDLLENGGKLGAKKSPAYLSSRITVLLMSWYLLFTIDSVTSLICAVLGSTLLLVIRGAALRRFPWRIEIVGLGSLGILLTLDSVLNITEALLLSLGRDMTLTTRTDIWSIVTNHQGNSLVGAGFNTFWTGERYKLLSEQVGGVIQAHNGYLEIYLNGGWVGIGLLGGVIISAYWRIRKQLILGIPEGDIRLIILLLAIIHNYSEASFNKTVLLWFVTMFALMQYNKPAQGYVLHPAVGGQNRIICCSVPLKSSHLG